MKKLKFIFISLLITIVVSCEKDDVPQTGNGDEDIPLIFESLEAESTVIEPGEYTVIHATASGYKLEFFWEATAGDILGSGAKVNYAASPCSAGKNIISCSVKDGYGNEEKKSIEITVI